METICLLSRKKVGGYINIDLDTKKSLVNQKLDSLLIKKFRRILAKSMALLLILLILLELRANVALIGAITITKVQMVPETEMLIGKTDFSIKATNPQNNDYRCALSTCAKNSIYDVNEMLESCGYEPFGSSSLD